MTSLADVEICFKSTKAEEFHLEILENADLLDFVALDFVSKYQAAIANLDSQQYEINGKSKDSKRSIGLSKKGFSSLVEAKKKVINLLTSAGIYLKDGVDETIDLVQKNPEIKADLSKLISYNEYLTEFISQQDSYKNITIKMFNSYLTEVSKSISNINAQRVKLELSARTDKNTKGLAFISNKTKGLKDDYVTGFNILQDDLIMVRGILQELQDYEHYKEYKNNEDNFNKFKKDLTKIIKEIGEN